MAQDRWRTKEILTCCKCLTVLSILGKPTSTDRHTPTNDLIYEAEVDVSHAPTREELLMERDRHAEHLKAQMLEHRAALIEAVTNYEPASQVPNRLVQLGLDYDKHLKAYHGYIQAVEGVSKD